MTKKKSALRPSTMFLHMEHMAKMKVLAEAQGLQTSQLVRIAIADYLRRSAKQN